MGLDTPVVLLLCLHYRLGNYLCNLPKLPIMGYLGLGLCVFSTIRNSLVMVLRSAVVTTSGMKLFTCKPQNDAGTLNGKMDLAEYNTGVS